MNLLGNIIWLIFGGFASFLGYMVSGLLFCVTIIGIPFGVQCFKIGLFTLMPFGREIRDVPGPTGCLATLFNIIWVFTGGIWVALCHFFFGVLLTLTVIGIPFGRQHFKLMSLTFAPFGKEIY
ncbi:YccF domain-containing protein [Chitinophaga sp. HK235]|uniref:YccF domain-containing protein n=1 Tax=Chitinophaga sp. HK235 TaxID=2952571 RepID=UPI001BA9D934|nr:YccF domain-containing protein [Chitinophaga sp. HK235]